VLLREFSVRSGSGGKGKFNGGDGVVREVEFIKNKMTIGILSERRAFEPNGICGGTSGLRGRNLLIKKDGRTVSLGGKNSVQVEKGDRVRILTPGGGGFGAM
jgi:5-oxoprolinase (ATP-hydrolysing)